MYYPLISSMNKSVGYTSRTTAFASATGITDVTILGALNTFDLGLISNSLDTKMKALYPFVGGTATTHKYNFMDSRDLNAAFRLQFSGGFTHSSTGALPITNGKAQTFYTPIDGDAGMFFYSRTNNSNFECTMGAYNSPLASQSIMFITPGTISYASMNSGVFDYIRPPTTTSLGFFGVIRIAGNVTSNFNGNTFTALATIANTKIPLNIFNRGGSEDLYSSREAAAAGLIENYTISELDILKTLVNNLQITLGRNV